MQRKQKHASAKKREKNEAINWAHLHDFINGCEMWILIMIWARAQCVRMVVNEKWTEWEYFGEKNGKKNDATDDDEYFASTECHALMVR